MQTTNNKELSPAILWWNGLKIFSEKCALLNKYEFDTSRLVASLTESEIEAIYKAEYPTPLTEDNEDLDKEVTELENDLYNQPTGAPPTDQDKGEDKGYTGWKVVNWGQRAQIRDENNNEVCVILPNAMPFDAVIDNGIPTEETTATANRIVQAVNNHDALVSALEMMLTVNPMSEAWKGAEENAKNLLLNIKTI